MIRFYKTFSGGLPTTSSPLGNNSVDLTPVGGNFFGVETPIGSVEGATDSPWGLGLESNAVLVGYRFTLMGAPGAAVGWAGLELGQNRFRLIMGGREPNDISIMWIDNQYHEMSLELINAVAVHTHAPSVVYLLPTDPIVINLDIRQLPAPFLSMPIRLLLELDFSNKLSDS